MRESLTSLGKFITFFTVYLINNKNCVILYNKKKVILSSPSSFLMEKETSGQMNPESEAEPCKQTTLRKANKYRKRMDCCQMYCTVLKETVLPQNDLKFAWENKLR